MEPWTAILYAIIVGIVSGIIAALIGYAKGTTIEKFNPYKMVLTLVIGGVVGAIAGYQGLDVMVPANFNQIYIFLYDAGIIGVINWLVLLIWRRSGLAAKYGDGDENAPAPPAAPATDADVEAAINNNTPKEP